MAITPTGAIFKTLSFDGESLRSYGVYISGEATFNAPAREVEMISIPGRSGQLALDKGRFENIEVTYPAGIYADTEGDFAEAVSELRNFLCSRSGYCRIEDDYNPNEFRMGIYKSGLEVTPALLKAGEFDLVFDCKPQRWLKSGEDEISVQDGDTITNPTLFDASPLLDITGYGVIGFNGYSIDATNINYGDIVIRRYRTESLSGIIEAGQQYYSFSFDDSVALNGDSITVGSLVFNVALSSIWTFDSERVIGSGFEYEYSTSGLSAYIKMEGVSFTLGTVGHKGYRAVFVDAYNVSRQIQILVDYDGNTSFTMAVSYTGIDSFVFASDSFILHSSKLITTGNYYIDTELGEAYKIEDGQAVSLNGYIDLGSDLPTLASGANSITADNTITDLKVTPRWWKI